jgi:hypothetical protein
MFGYNVERIPEERTVKKVLNSTAEEKRCTEQKRNW